MRALLLLFLLLFRISSAFVVLPHHHHHHKQHQHRKKNIQSQFVQGHHNSASKCHHQFKPTSTTLLYDAQYPWENRQDLKLFQQEETLLKMHCKCMHDQTLDDVLPKVQKYVQSFPFAAVLPVQPLQYLPTEDGGVEVLFLRKKTQEKGSVDGGLRFFVVPTDDYDDNGENNEHSKKWLEIIVKRYSEGQTCGKMFAEKLVVQAFVDAMTRKPNAEVNNKSIVDKEPPTVDAITIESVFHRWMDL